MEEETLLHNMKIESLIQIKYKLDQYCTDDFLLEIYEKLSTYIDNNCHHTYVNDIIDITPDNSRTLTYCSICGKSK